MEHQSGNWDLVIKVKYGNHLKRFKSFVKQRRLEYNMTTLRSKIKDAFNLDQDAELALSYEDDDGDTITLEQDEDLIDAIINQQLNPLRIEVQLRTPSAELVQCFRSMLMSSYSTSANGPVMQELDSQRRINWGRIGDINQSFHSDHCGCHSSPHVCGLRPKKLKLKSRFIQDLTIPDGTRVTTSTPWIGGDQIGNCHAVQLQIPPTGFPVEENIDVQVDFIAPSKPGRYISIWRLLSPSGKNFGHCFWVLIKVELPSAAIGTTSSSLDLNLSPENKYAGAGLLEPIALADQRMHCVVKQPDTVGSSQQSNKPLIDLNEDGPNVNSTVDLGDTKEAVSEWGRLLSELHDMGFCDEDLNRRLLVEYDGSIKRVVLDLIAKEKMV
ncbi:PB1 domain-containing protein [Carex littledalei]|uniref:PB1 domain-containing protein n=1 Tax=Carex littledalei TaxID=544730 RepID=A0A833R721_9POAL|nr:PB1 domain-containing protein [Carex littledalei]